MDAYFVLKIHSEYKSVRNIKGKLKERQSAKAKVRSNTALIYLEKIEAFVSAEYGQQ